MTRFNMFTRTLPLPFAIASVMALSVGCADSTGPDDPEPEGNVEEVITAVELTFTPTAGDPIVAIWEDPENDGDPIIDDIVLEDAETYTLDIRFLNQLEDPAEDITEEVDDESDEHQVLIYGGAVDGPAATNSASPLLTHAYSDEDGDQLPVGLSNSIETTATGTGTFSVMLRHLPVEDGTANKNDSIAADFAAGGSTAINGDVDADVDFDLTVQ